MRYDNPTDNPSGDTLRAQAQRSLTAFIAHRGASHEAPENTLPAFHLAWQQSADGIEGDFRLTKDGKIVCIHDATTQRTAGKNIKVAEATLAELQQLDAGIWKGEQWQGARIPTIDEVLATLPEGKRIFIEVKCGPEILPPLKVAIAESGVQPEQIVIISLDDVVIAEGKRQLPHIKALWVTDLNTDRKRGNVNPSLKEIVATLKKIGADGVDCRSHPVIDQQFIQTLRTAHKEVHVWTVDEVQTAKQYQKLGIDSLTSNCAGWLKQQLNSRTDNLGMDY